MPHLHTRRSFLTVAGSLFAWSYLPKEALAAGKDPRLLVIVMRGGLDGLAALPPLSDPAYQDLRGKIALQKDGENAALPLDGFFSLHPALANLHKLYTEKQALFVHSVHSSYRQRSHFDGQDVLESGYEKAGFHDSGWLNRVFSVIPRTEKVKAPLGVGPLVPLIVRGKAEIRAWQPQVLQPMSDDTKLRLLSLYEQQDAEVAKAVKNAITTPLANRKTTRQNYLHEAMVGAAKIMSEPNGPRLGALSIDGFDTHASEGGATGQLANRFKLFDAALTDMKAAFGEAWKETVVICITEFGRTAKVNGTDGTDHGMATVAMLMGGALKGGKVVADWAGLSHNSLYEGRDLKPTTDLRAVLKGVLRDHIGVDVAKHGEVIFPGSLTVKAMDGLVG